MPKRFRKRSHRRRRVFKRRRKGFRKSGGYDSVFKLKFAQIYVFQTQNTATPTTGAITCNWGSQGVSTSYDGYIDDCAEFQLARDNWKYWRINGIKMEFRPYGDANAGANQTLTYSTHVASNALGTWNATAPNTGYMMKEPDYKCYKGNQSITKYINLRKFFSSRSEKWLPTGTYYPAAHTLFVQEIYGFGQAQKLGNMVMTWYCSFKGFNKN